MPHAGKMEEWRAQCVARATAVVVIHWERCAAAPMGPAEQLPSLQPRHGCVDCIHIIHSQQPLQQRLVALKLLVVHLLLHQRHIHQPGGLGLQLQPLLRQAAAHRAIVLHRRQHLQQG